MGKLNILQHKSWHVYNEENRERVRKDEENAKIEEDKTRQQVIEAEREVRITALRARAREKDAILPRGESDSVILATEVAAVAPLEPSAPKHFSLFGDEETAEKKLKRTNADYEADKNAAEKKISAQFTMYLGETLDGKKDVPWYATKEGRPDYNGTSTSKPKKKGTDPKRDERRKHREDPLAIMPRTSNSVSSSRDHKNSSSSAPSSSKSKLEELRAARLAREKKERQKANSLTMPQQKVRHEAEQDYFHSQFNPSLAKRRSDTHHRSRPY
ncbi:hypothetical protein DFS34DRAFT_577221 [Phlyctochytrium arcticum]|nr:hypothetical protein DFS34DRAFT_577221 [Phlyctochytrium arcticum]